MTLFLQQRPRQLLFLLFPLVLFPFFGVTGFANVAFAGRRTMVAETRREWLVGNSMSTSAAAVTEGGGESPAAAAAVTEDEDEDEIDFDEPEDPVIHIKPAAMNRLRELRDKQAKDGESGIVLRMGVRNGGCSGLSYVMDFSTEDDIQDDDAVDEYSKERIKCVVDAKSMLYLYGLELDFSEELIGGGFKFFNPNAQDSCGCGSSFGV